MEYAIIISGTIGGWWNGCSAEYVRYILDKNKDKDVHVGFCSLGGLVKDGLEMYQAFKDHGNVHAHAFGMNASISTIAMLGCKSIDIVKGSFFLIHNVSTFISQFEQSNKERIDELIRSLKDERDSLQTFDDVLAQMYADKTGKTIEECRAQMTKGNWLTAQQAVDFGLVDSIRVDASSEKEASNYTNQFINTYSNQHKDAGFPPLPSMSATVPGTVPAVCDEEGNPTPGFLQKTWQGLKGLIRNQHAESNNKTDMIKFVNVMNLLDIADGFKPQDDGSIALSQEQLKKIEDKLAAVTAAAAEDTKTINQLKADLTASQEQVKQKDEEITTLKNSAGDKTEELGGDGADATTAQDLFNLVKEA